MTRSECATCTALAAAGVTTVERETCPPEAERLEVFAVGEGHGSFTQLRRCNNCGSIYRYRYHSEYDVTGSWDEYYLWRLEDEAAALVAPMLGRLPADVFEATLVRALQSPHPQAREAAAIVGWIVAGNGSPLTVSIAALAGNLADENFMGGNFCYRALLSYLHRGPAEASSVLAALASTGVGARDERFTWILERDAREVLAAAQSDS